MRFSILLHLAFEHITPRFWRLTYPGLIQWRPLMLLSSAVKLSRFAVPGDTLSSRQAVARQWAAYRGTAPLAVPRRPSRRSLEQQADAHPFLFLGGFLLLLTVTVIGLWTLMGWLLPF
jgi:hypothetical protein